MLTKGLPRIVVVGGIALIAAVLVISAAGIHGESNAAARKDVALTGCVRDTAGRVRIDGTLHNPTSDRSDYFIDLVIEDRAGKRLDKITSITSGVFPDQAVLWEANTMVHFKRGVTCSVADVVRSPAVVP